LVAVLGSGTGQRCCTSGAVRFSITGPGRYTTTAYEAVDLCGLLRPRTVLPVHYERWGHFGGGAKPSVSGQTFSYLADTVAPIEQEFAGAGHDVSSTLR
jgi:hypothetical protein